MTNKQKINRQLESGKVARKLGSITLTSLNIQFFNVKSFLKLQLIINVLSFT